MHIEQTEKKRFKFPRGSGLYLVLCLTVIAAGVGVWGAVSNSLSSNAFSIPSATDTQSTINWANYVTRPVVQSEQAANVPQTNIPDDREVKASTATTQDASKTPYTGNFSLPFGTKISKDYSNGEMVKSATMGDWRVHNGVDFEGEINGEVVAIQDGVVKSVKIDPLWGVVLTIDHGQGLLAKYCGLSENSTPNEGKEVKKGEPVGVIAQVPCESSEGVHLHFETTVNGKIADPLAVMNKD
ncbi:MAG: M23 family metallopeptidase [Oscillospiraceae bacterium]|nr:M23 family metallopeptidase [Oscillospiraceae bacterium]